jgi:hypothetical protein
MNGTTPVASIDEHRYQSMRLLIAMHGLKLKTYYEAVK